MQSVQQRLEQLAIDLLADPIRISVYHDLPFAIFHYPPKFEFPFRAEVNRFKIRLENQGKKVIIISLAEILWETIRTNDSIENTIASEIRFGYRRKADDINAYLSLEDFTPLYQIVLNKINELNAQPDLHIIFLMRAGCMAPNLYRMSILLNELHGKTMVPTILFYPGTKEGEAQLRYMDLEGREA
ncbi:DUF1788 domain-containing protein, partial [candidate division KSB1 bacterium]|nr:DUF1788 domain-containing protein [candidate division KSB1 bacterium]